MRLLIVNTVALNAGDAAILHGELRMLRSVFGDSLAVTVADDDPVAARRLYPGIEFTAGFNTRRPAWGPAWWSRLSRSVRRRRTALAVWLLGRAPRLAERLFDANGRAHLDQMRAADAVLATGGTYFVEHYPIRTRAHELMAAHALGRPVYLLTQSLGPFLHRNNRRLMARALRGVERVFVRDERSRGNLVGLSVPEDRVVVCPDAAFALADEAPRRRAHTGPLRIAVSVREWKHFRTRPAAEGRGAYRAAVAAVVGRLAAQGAEVSFVSTCQGVAEYWTDDARFARSLVDELLPDAPGIQVDGAFRSPSELVEHLRNFDLVIATRMHAAILALVAGVPVVPIAYEFKMTELFASLGMPWLVEDIETITAARLDERVTGALARLDGLRAEIEHTVPALRRGAFLPAEAVARVHAARVASAAGAPGISRRAVPAAVNASKPGTPR
jgi:colanic acid/amylovoran biosynthesis protein